jgi:hypothetical protein
MEGAAKGRQAIARDTLLLRQYRNQNSQGGFHYNGSDLQKHLRKDVLAGDTDGMTPTQVQNSRPSIYKVQGLTLQEFANHLWHERRRKERSAQGDKYRERMQFITAVVDPNHHPIEEEGNQEQG